MTRAIPYLWYPLFFAIAIGCYSAMLAHRAPLLAALYFPIALVAVAIILLEVKDPEHKEWRPRWFDVKADAAFMVVVQVILPRALLVVLVLFLGEQTHSRSPSPLWPHAWPLALQALLMVLIVDLMRYWLHRACHTFPLLWRLHEVHHSPDILYALNVGRFHPLEKVLQFFLDTVPFFMLGVAPEVLAAYFLLYSVNGFFQHSNVRLRYGWLNYLVGSAETHRWHHARNPKTAYCNFSNTTIVWDLVFGTWYLPKDQPVDDIGIPDRAYPKGFLAQMVTPFRSSEGITSSFSTGIANLAIQAQLRLTLIRSKFRLARDLHDPMRAQRALLAHLLKSNRDTSFGRQHRFEELRTYEDFRDRVPVQEFEALRPYIEAEIRQGEKALTAEAPIRYLRTSGTTGQPKDIPVTPSHLRQLRAIHRLSVAHQFRHCSEAFAGGILAITSTAFEGTLANGKPYGSASGIVADSTPRIVRDKFVLLPEVLTVADSRLKYLLILRLALARNDITYLGTANSSTLLTVMKLYREHNTDLVDDLRRGGFFLSDTLQKNVLHAVQSRLMPLPGRADEIAELPGRPSAARIADLWPRLKLVVTWTGGSAGIAVSALRKELDPSTRIHELGYLSSEFRGTITLGRRPGSGLPTFDNHFFEFVERDRWDRGDPVFLTLDQLRKGSDYYIFVTTPSGLYRYFINDLVRVTGFLHRTPLLKFMQKGKGVTNITGEKLYEAQVLNAVNQVAGELGRAVRFVMMVADEEASTYRLYVEMDAGEKISAASFAAQVDARLGTLNLEYAAKRESGRLHPLLACFLRPGTEDTFRQICVRQGQREGQFKTLALTYASKISFDFDAYVQT